MNSAEGGVPVEVHQALQAAMDKLQQRFTSLMQEKVDLKERVEELEHRCIQLSGETDTIGETAALAAVLPADVSSLSRPSTVMLTCHFFGVLAGEYIALYQSQRAIMKQKHHEKEQYISMLAQDKEEMKVL